jgi:predicted NodU family carbamoyl transferase
MNVLGLAGFSTDAAAVLVAGDRVVAAAREEWFTRVPRDASFPRRSARFCLRRSGLDPTELDRVVWFDKPLKRFERVLLDRLRAFPRESGRFVDELEEWFSERLFVRVRITAEIDVPAERVAFADPLLAEAAAAHLCSRHPRAAILVAEGPCGTGRAAIASGEGTAVRLLAVDAVHVRRESGAARAIRLAAEARKLVAGHALITAGGFARDPEAREALASRRDFEVHEAAPLSGGAAAALGAALFVAAAGGAARPGSWPAACGPSIDPTDLEDDDPWRSGAVPPASRARLADDAEAIRRIRAALARGERVAVADGALALGDGLDPSRIVISAAGGGMPVPSRLEGRGPRLARAAGEDGTLLGIAPFARLGEPPPHDAAAALRCFEREAIEHLLLADQWISAPPRR